MKILAFDTSSPHTAVAVTDGARVLAEDDSPTDALHGEVLVPRIRAVLAAAGLPLDAIELVGVGVGPGSFTGLRVGIATAKGLAIATGVALVGVDSLAVVARAVLGGSAGAESLVAVPVVDAHRGEVFVAAYARGDGDALHTIASPACERPERTIARLRDALDAHAPDAEVVLCGDALAAHAPAFSAAFGDRLRLADAATPRGRLVAEEARTAFARAGASNVATLEPVYLREADVTLPKA